MTLAIEAKNVPLSIATGIGRPADKRASHVLPRATMGTAREAGYLDGTDPFAEYPKLRVWQLALNAAMASFDADLAEAKMLGGDEGLAYFVNALTRCDLAIGLANEEVGIPFTQSDVKKILFENWPTRDIEGAEARAIVVRIAYAGSIRISASGTKDSRIEAAMLVAAHYEGMESSDPIETVRKSIQRFRKTIRGKSIFRLDRENLKIECLNADSVLLEGLPGKGGRPRKL